jgi:flagellar FliL protein
MAEDKGAGEAAPAKKKTTKLPLLIGLALAAVCGGGGFYGVWSGMILGPAEAAHAAAVEAPPLPDIGYVKIDPLLVNLGDRGSARVLRFQAQVEVNAPYLDDVTRLVPRIVDVLNGYLRAVDIADIEDRSALVRLRAQMLRRIQLVTGEGRVRDLLIQEFVLN